MKSKSSHHRTENRFKFLKFSERIAKINIDVIRKGGRTENKPRDADSFFGEGLAKWAELNCTQDFVAFHREVFGCTNSFAQLVHHEQKVVEALQRYLKNSISLAYPPLLDLIVQLARDLQTDFYPHFRAFFDIIVSLLNTQDTEVIECAFQTLVYLFKFLWRYLLRDIKDVFGFYSPLLSLHQREHIRNFAAESFGFLMRKVQDPSDLFEHMLSSLEQQPDQVEGVGRLFFEMTKGVCKQFHSCTEKVLPILLDKLGPFPSVEGRQQTALPWQLVLETLSETLMSMAKYTSKEHTQVVWKSLQNCMLNLYQSLTTGEYEPELSSEYFAQLSRALRLVRQWVEWSNGGLVAEPTELAKVILELYSSTALPDDCGDELLNLTVSLLTATKVTMPQDIIDKLVTAIYSSKYEVNQLLRVSRDTFKMSHFEQDLLPSLLQNCHSNMASKSSSTKEAILFTLTDLVLQKQTQITDSAVLEDYKPYLLDFRMAVHRG
ncbi:small subunit processome component 20 homolog [Amphiura filiformis]|uniref:small subunit processome component 20 homolog n=1 Tax=Amphiura filiformis TaxID=82378 RepID=UPI003B211D9F